MKLLLQLLVISFFESKLLSVRIVQRHGERTPLREIPVVNLTEPMGIITKKGLAQSIKIGQEFRSKYLTNDSTEFPSQYEDQRFYFHSTNIDRAKQTQAAFVHGLFGKENGPRDPEDSTLSTPLFDTGLTPYPAMAMLEHNDFLLLSVSICPVSLRADEDLRNNDPTLKQFYKDKNATLQKMFSQIKTSDSGYNISELIDTLIYLNDTQQLPEGMTQDDFKEYLDIFDFITTHSSDIHNQEYCDVVTGLFISQMLREVASESQNIDNHTVFYHYAAHDWTINTIFGCLNLNNKINPRYGSYVLIEAEVDENMNGNENSSKKNNMNIFKSLLRRFTSYISSLFKSSSSSSSSSDIIRSSIDTSHIKFKFSAVLDPDNDPTPVVFRPKHCPQDQDYCPFDVFQQPWSAWWPVDRRLDWMGEVCGLERKSNTNTLLYVFISLIILFLILLVIFSIICVKYVNLQSAPPLHRAPSINSNNNIMNSTDDEL